jgi:hypothetical protein
VGSPTQSKPQKTLRIVDIRVREDDTKSPLLDAGKGHAFFLRKDVVAQIQIPSRRMLREAARSRTVAAKKQRWAKIRQGKETALGKPLRRVRTNFSELGNRLN